MYGACLSFLSSEVLWDFFNEILVHQDVTKLNDGHWLWKNLVDAVIVGLDDVFWFNVPCNSDNLKLIVHTGLDLVVAQGVV
jgi:hypothetical protein